MKRSRLNTLGLAATMWSFFFAAHAFSQGTTLSIGSKAPELRYSQWLKGRPLLTFDQNRLYVVEFWATWCVPCRIAMPHLSGLAKKYEKTATFIGVDVWEMTGKKPYESALPEVAQFVADMGDKMAYNVIADNNEQYMSEHWMKAAGQSGIPATFLIKDKRVIWIGLPGELENVMDKVLSGSYNEADFKGGFDAKVSLAAAESAKMTAVLGPINDRIVEGRYREALSMIDTALVKNPAMALTLNDLKFNTLLGHISEADAMLFAESWTKENSTGAYMVAKTISDKGGLTKETYLYAARIFEEKLKNPKALAPVLQHAVASCYQKAGDRAKAIEAEEKAIEGAKAALTIGKWPGAIMASTITQYQETLEHYKNH